MSALLKEVELFPGTFPAETQRSADAAVIGTIYIGGGTPSLLETDEIVTLLAKIRSVFRVDPAAEITLEANPDDINEEKLVSWQAAGINRLSIGVQSFFEEDLRWMNRAHNAVQAESALVLARRYFDNITMDLIYGTPGLTDEKWKANVEKALALGIPHLSCYALTVEPNTPLQKMISHHQRQDVNPDNQSAQFILLMQWLQAAGFEHYEISNFAKPGYRSRHNSSYWQGKPYYGFGPSAHSFNGAERWWNVANNNRYITSISGGVIPFEKEELTPVQRFNEYIMISLRTGAGLSLSRLRDNEWAMPESVLEAALSEVNSIADGYLAKGLLVRSDDNLVLTMEGKLLADGIAADLFAN